MANGLALYHIDSLCTAAPPPTPPYLLKHTHTTYPTFTHGPDEIQTLNGSKLKWPNSVSGRAKWKVVKSFEPLLHYDSSKHIQLGPKFREDIKAPLHVTLEDDNRQAPLKLLRQSTIKGPRGRTPRTSYWLLMACVCHRRPSAAVANIPCNARTSCSVKTGNPFNVGD